VPASRIWKRPESPDPAISAADSAEVSVSVQNALTDYDFKVENLSIESRIEKSSLNPNQLPETNFEVLDWKNLRIRFGLNEPLQRLLNGRRLQFRIVDKERGASDWYTVNKTFVRLPKINSLKCLAGNCEIKGEGLDYLSQVSLDGGLTWYPKLPETLKVEITASGQNVARIPAVGTQNQLRIRLRDYYLVEGLMVR